MELCSGCPPSRAVLVFRLRNYNWLASTKESTRLEVSGPADMVVVAPAEGCLLLVLFFPGPFEPFEFLKANVCDPRAPKGSRGTFGVRRNFANFPRAAQGPYGPFGIYSVHAFDLWAPQGLRCPLGVLELFLETLVVHRTVPGAPQGFLGPPRESHTQLSQWLARKGTLLDLISDVHFWLSTVKALNSNEVSSKRETAVTAATNRQQKVALFVVIFWK